MSGDMRPALPQDDVRNARPAYVEPVSDIPLQYAALGVEPADFADIGIPKLCLVVLRTPRRVCLCSGPPSFSISVGGVVGVGSYEQMAGPHAGRIVALMAYDQAVRDRAEVQFPGITVGSYVSMIQGQPTVTSPASLLEVPATPCLDDAAPEPLLQASSFAFVPAWLATEPPLPLSPLPGCWAELGAAVLAVSQGWDAHVLDLARDSGMIPDPATGPTVIA